ncbi:hypothetical protein CHARACLAT_032838, partial [Characodon lateralis]|nr:hypothetical protein [Characodon lateralis]
SLQLLQKQKISDSANQPLNKKARLEPIQSPNRKLPPESTPRVMFTGFEPMQVQQYTKRLHALGGEVAESSQKATHLLASKVTRTVKFLTAMSVVKYITTPEWLEESWRSQKFVDEQSYTLRDAEAEVLFSFSLEESLKRAHSAPLFKVGLCSKNVHSCLHVGAKGGKENVSFLKRRMLRSLLSDQCLFSAADDVRLAGSLYIYTLLKKIKGTLK